MDKAISKEQFETIMHNLFKKYIEDPTSFQLGAASSYDVDYSNNLKIKNDHHLPAFVCKTGAAKGICIVKSKIMAPKNGFKYDIEFIQGRHESNKLGYVPEGWLWLDHGVKTFKNIYKYVVKADTNQKMDAHNTKVEDIIVEAFPDVIDDIILKRET